MLKCELNLPTTVPSRLENNHVCDSNRDTTNFMKKSCSLDARTDFKSEYDGWISKSLLRQIFIQSRINTNARKL